MKKIERVTCGESSKSPEATVTALPHMSDAAMSLFGCGRFGYIRAMAVEEAKKLYPALKDIPDGTELFCVRAANGEHLMLSDNRDDAVAYAMTNDLDVLLYLH